MTKKETGLIPLDQANFVDERIHFDFSNLPRWIDQSNIIVDTQGIIRLMNMSGFKSLDIRGKSGQRTSKISAAPSGNLGDGPQSAIAATKSRFADDDANSMDLEFGEDDDDDGTHSTRWANASISINLAEVIQNMQLTEMNVRSEEDWADVLDSMIRDGLREIGTAHLMSLEKFELFMNIVLVALHVVYTVYFLTHTEGVGGAALLQLALDLARLHLQTSYQYYAVGLIKPLIMTRRFPRTRVTFFPLGPELDRAVVLQLLAQKPIIHHRKDLRPDQIKESEPEA